MPSLAQQASDLINRAARLAVDRLPGAQAELFARFVRCYYDQLAPGDVVERNELDLYGAALAHWRLAHQRTPGQVTLRVYNPDFEQDGWQSTHTVVEVCNDDMPFLVDSVSMELNRRGWGLHIIIHPVLNVRRSADGELLDLVDEAGGAGVVRESFIHIEVDRQSDAEVLADVHERLLAVLADVRAAVEDWQPMREKVREIITQLDHNPPPVEAHEVEEAQTFLQWLHDDHFTFLGYRDYELVQANGDDMLRRVPSSGLGILREAGDGGPSASFSKLPPDVRSLARFPEVLMLTKANAQATVHRPTHLDYVGVKVFDEHGEPVGERRFLGLYTSTVYNSSVTELPIVRRKVAEVINRAGFPKDSHSGKDLLAVLETYPRDALFQITADELYDNAIGILRLQGRKRVRVFVRRDRYGRFFSCLVFVPRDRYDTAARQRIERILLAALDGNEIDYSVRLDESVLARVHFIVYVDPYSTPSYDVADLEARVAETVRRWVDDLHEALIEQRGEDTGTKLLHRYSDAFPAGYRDDFPARVAVADIARIEELDPGGDLAMNLYRRPEDPEGLLRFKLYRSGRAMALTDVLPVLENMGVKVIDQRPYELTPTHRDPLWVYDFGLSHDRQRELASEEARRVFVDTFAQVWRGEAENDGFNRLAVVAGLPWQDINVLRGYGRYLRQTETRFSQTYMEDALSAHPDIARQLTELFHARFDPVNGDPDRAQQLADKLTEAIDAVESLDEDRILRSFLGVITATVRTSRFQDGGEAAPQQLSFKLDPRGVPELPRPLPAFEIFVYSPRVEGVHLRAGEVARGGVRWSDRREDFRTEILGLMKAQVVKNAVIVPVGAKGGFVVKQPPADPAEVWEEVRGCYRMFIRGLLDITDNIVDGQVAPPPQVVRYDADDPYLVVAADKGTATFSDMANEVAASYRFWLGDAFASGGSAGYDHKEMGITARGAWESVNRHFLELGHDVQTEPFTVIGIGDMSGDVFGNGVLLSRQIKLIGAFDHRHVFLDPDPDPERSYAERRRLFDLAGSTWDDYDRELISEGGGVYPRSAKSIPLTPQIRERLHVEAEALTPAELISALLRAPADLLWNGGIGTYVKARDETHAAVGDKANDAVRVDACDLRCRVIGEGGNLGLTQRGRIEFALHGGRVNADSIDNSAGVDCSDHEVNIKILLDAVVAAGDLTMKQRNEFLRAMTDEVADLVLANNYAQNQALSNALAHAASMVDVHRRYIRDLEQAGKLDRRLEFLPDEEGFAERKAAGIGLTLPEFSILLAYTKNTLFDEILASDVPDDPALTEELHRYFPKPLRERFADRMSRHRLRREIVTTELVNQMVNRNGTTFAYRLQEETGGAQPEIARAFVVAREVFGMPAVWEAVEALDAKVSATTQTHLLLEARKLVERASRWLLRHRPHPLDLEATSAFFAPQVEALRGLLPELLTAADRERVEEQAQRLLEEGVPSDLAARVACFPPLFSALDLAEVVAESGRDMDAVAATYFRLSEELALDHIRERVVALPRDTRWQTLARDALRDDFYTQHRLLTAQVLASAQEQTAAACIATWRAANASAVERCLDVLSDVHAAETFDLATLSVALRELRNLAQSDPRRRAS